MSQIHKCEVCGSKVRIVGTGTMHYEPVITLEEILGGLPKKKPAISYTAGYLPSEMEQNIYNSAVEDCEDKIKELFK